MWDWGQLHHLEVGRFGEEFTRIQFAMRGFRTYQPYADNHAVDFIASHLDGRSFPVQVKSVRSRNYAFVRKAEFDQNPGLHLALVVLDEGLPPDLYVFPRSAWDVPSKLLVDRDYVDRKSDPELGVEPRSSNQELLNQHRAADYL